jgi:RimJ/RimL family protein N-acetyltransferase
MFVLLISRKHLFMHALPGHRTFCAALGRTITFRSLDLPGDLDLIHDWVNRDYALAFWQMAGSREQLLATYTAILDGPDGHSFIGLLEGTPVCQIDLYRVEADEIGRYIPDADERTCGFHLLMAPNDRPIPGLSVSLVRAFVGYYFAFSWAAVMYAEPDAGNERACALLERCGFRLLGAIALPGKAAKLYRMTREEYLEISRCARNDGEGIL